MVVTKAIEDSKLNRDGLSPGMKAPVFTLPQLDGGSLCLEEFHGRHVLIVFSDPDCEPCNLLLPQLQELVNLRPDANVLLIGRGDREANLAKITELGLRFPVVLQRSWEVSKDYGIFATPVGYLIDTEGVIVSGVEVGPGAILGLARAAWPSPVEAVRQHSLETMLENRLALLRSEMEKGKTELERLSTEYSALRDTVLRISGAAQILEEILAGGNHVANIDTYNESVAGG